MNPPSQQLVATIYRVAAKWAPAGRVHELVDDLMGMLRQGVEEYEQSLNDDLKKSYSISDLLGTNRAFVRMPDGSEVMVTDVIVSPGKLTLFLESPVLQTTRADHSPVPESTPSPAPHA